MPCRSASTPTLYICEYLWDQCPQTRHYSYIDKDSVKDNLWILYPLNIRYWDHWPITPFIYRHLFKTVVVGHYNYEHLKPLLNISFLIVLDWADCKSKEKERTLLQWNLSQWKTGFRTFLKAPYLSVQMRFHWVASRAKCQQRTNGVCEPGETRW